MKYELDQSFLEKMVPILDSALKNKTSGGVRIFNHVLNYFNKINNPLKKESKKEKVEK